MQRDTLEVPIHGMVEAREKNRGILFNTLIIYWVSTGVQIKSIKSGVTLEELHNHLERTASV